MRPCSHLPRLGLLMLLAAACLTTGCSPGPKTSDTDIQQIQLAELRELLQTQPKASRGPLAILRGDAAAQPILVDVRPAAKFAAGHIPGAVNIPLPDLKRDDPRLANASTIIVYDAGFDDYLSAAAAKKLLALGFNNVQEFRGGLDIWSAEKLPVEPAPAPSTDQ